MQQRVGKSHRRSVALTVQHTRRRMESTRHMALNLGTVERFAEPPAVWIVARFTFGLDAKHRLRRKLFGYDVDATLLGRATADNAIPGILQVFTNRGHYIILGKHQPSVALRM